MYIIINYWVAVSFIQYPIIIFDMIASTDQLPVLLKSMVSAFNSAVFDQVLAFQISQVKMLYAFHRYGIDVPFVL